MTDQDYRCKSCGTALQGRAVYCVLCFARLTIPCPGCVRIDTRGVQSVRRNGKGGRPTNCKWCKNKRYVFRSKHR
jgi:hypothetical protein